MELFGLAEPARTILLVHYGALFAGLAIWSFRSVRKNALSLLADILGFVAVPVAVFMYMFVSEPGSYEGTAAGWFLILSALSFYLLPLATLLLHFLLGRLIGMQIYRMAA